MTNVHTAVPHIDTRVALAVDDPRPLLVVFPCRAYIRREDTGLDSFTRYSSAKHLDENEHDSREDADTEMGPWMGRLIDTPQPRTTGTAVIARRVPVRPLGDWHSASANAVGWAAGLAAIPLHTVTPAAHSPPEYWLAPQRDDSRR